VTVLQEYFSEDFELLSSLVLIEDTKLKQVLPTARDRLEEKEIGVTIRLIILAFSYT
jgi:hypothetical protein